MDWVGVVVDLVRAFFKAFSHAVIEYPLPTAVIFAASFFYVWPEVRLRFADRLAIAAGGVQFVLTVFASNVIGWIFNTSLEIAKWLFGVGTFSLSIFSDHPIEFVENMVVWIVVAAALLLYAAHWRYRNILRSWLFVAVLPVLWLTYISTNIHVHLLKSGASVQSQHVSEKA